MSVLALCILLGVVAASLLQPRVGNIVVRPQWAALSGALAMMAFGFVSPSEAFDSLRFMVMPLITLVSLMVMTLVADKVGLFVSFTRWLAKVSKGDAKRLFTYLFFGGTLIGALFTNDAAVLILTPLVGTLIAEIKTEQWNSRSELPYFFAVLYVANLVGLLVISNPINIVVANSFDISFLEYAKWMVLPATASIIVTFVALRFYFRNDLPGNYNLPTKAPVVTSHVGFRRMAAGLIGLTLIGFFSENLTNIPVYIIALGGATLITIGYVRTEGGSLAPIARNVAWDVILFVAAIFVVALGIRNAGITADLGENLRSVHDQSQALGIAATSGTASFLSALMNNHPVAYTMSLAIEDMHLSQGAGQLQVFAALIGGDLGPKMLPIGSLAALLWFRLLRDRGIQVSYWEYIKLGVPVTVLAVIAAVAVLLAEAAIF